MLSLHSTPSRPSVWREGERKPQGLCCVLATWLRRLLGLALENVSTTHTRCNSKVWPGPRAQEGLVHNERRTFIKLLSWPAAVVEGGGGGGEDF